LKEEIETILQEELEALKDDIIKRHENAKQVASGKTRDAFEIEVDRLHGILLGAPYSAVLERGRKPGKVPYKFYEILKKWAEVKGITFETETDLNRWAYFTSKKIEREGTKLYQSGNNEDIFTTAVIEFEERLNNKIGGIFAAEIQNSIFTK